MFIFYALKRVVSFCLSCRIGFTFMRSRDAELNLNFICYSCHIERSRDAFFVGFLVSAPLERTCVISQNALFIFASSCRIERSRDAKLNSFMPVIYVYQGAYLGLPTKSVGLAHKRWACPRKRAGPQRGSGARPYAAIFCKRQAKGFLLQSLAQGYSQTMNLTVETEGKPA